MEKYVKDVFGEAFVLAGRGAPNGSDDQGNVVFDAPLELKVSICCCQFNSKVVFFFVVAGQGRSYPFFKLWLV
jgi:hypothetical protein